MNYKVSLIDLARQLENDLIIYETAPEVYKLVYKDQVELKNDNNLFYKVRQDDIERFNH